MKLDKILVIVKRTALTLLEAAPDAGSKRMLALIEKSDESVASIRAAHEQHVDSVRRVRATLRQLGLSFRETQDLPRRPIRGYDLVISVGGDGTTLSVSHEIRDETPLLGVNSAPSFSTGYLTGTTALELGARLTALAEDRLAPISVQRLALRIGKKALPSPALNDVLFCANNPAQMTRYRLFWPDGEEMQRSSGVWVSSPAGSTGALASAGGPILPLTARQFAFMVREPYSPPGEAVRFKSAVLVKDNALTLECRIHEASVFIDGSHQVLPVPFGETVTFTLHDEPLRLVRGLHGQ